MLCVATAEEALQLRNEMITVPILLLSEPPRDAIGPCYLNDITFTVYTIDTINVIAAFATKDRPAHVHLKVDTGMNRVGIGVEDSLMFARHISKHDSLKFEGIFTHFASADEPTNPQTSKQLEKFERVLDEIEMAGLTPPLIHAANSAAALRIPSSRFSMVRCGISLYGVYPDPRGRDIIDLSQVVSLTSEIAFIKSIKEGEAVSYGGRFVASKQTKIATIPIGYGDGVPRNLGTSGGSFLIMGVRCPVAGRVTMDQTMVDVGNLSVNVGDKVTLLGTQGSTTITSTEWADLTGTISYEILCNLSERLNRIYD
jgi:alanine racemase